MERIWRHAKCTHTAGNELVVTEADDNMSFGYRTLVYDLNVMKAEMVRWDDIKDDFKDFDEVSRNEIKRLLDMLLWKKTIDEAVNGRKRKTQ